MKYLNSELKCEESTFCEKILLNFFSEKTNVAKIKRISCRAFDFSASLSNFELQNGISIAIMLEHTRQKVNGARLTWQIHNDSRCSSYSSDIKTLNYA